MNRATKFLVMALFIGVVCSNVGARKLDKVSKELMDQKLLDILPPFPSIPLPGPVPIPPMPLPIPIPGAEAASATQELMNQKSLSLPTMPLPPLPTMPLPPVGSLPVVPPVSLPVPSLGSEATSATKGGGVKNGVGLSKETKLGISISKTAATNSLGDELVVTVTSSAYNSKSANGNAAASPSGPNSGASGSTSEGTYGSVTADGPNASAYSRSTAYGQAGADAAASPDGATGSGYGTGYAYTDAGGSIGNSNP